MIELLAVVQALNSDFEYPLLFGSIRTDAKIPTYIEELVKEYEVGEELEGNVDSDYYSKSYSKCHSKTHTRCPGHTKNHGKLGC